MRQVKINRTLQPGLFEQFAEVTRLPDAIEIALASLKEQARGYLHKIIAYSGGKDSTALLVLIVWAIREGYLTEADGWSKENLHIVYSNTGQELPPLHQNALAFLETLAAEGYNVLTTQPPAQDTFFVQMLGRGLPTPGGPFRWCVGKLKIDPISSKIDELYEAFGFEGTGQKLLTITGVRKGESDARDQRLYTVCTRDGECGTGAWQPGAKKYDLLAPLLRWRTCHVFDFLHDLQAADGLPRHNYREPKVVARIYGDQDIRTGCNGCPVASRDYALENVIKNLPEYTYLKPLLRLRELWEVFRTRRDFRHRNDGTGPKEAKDLGPLTIEARKWGFNFLMEMQSEIDKLAQEMEVPTAGYTILTGEQIRLIEAHWVAKTYPKGWDGTQPVGETNDKMKLAGQMGLFAFGE